MCLAYAYFSNILFDLNAFCKRNAAGLAGCSGEEIRAADARADFQSDARMHEPRCLAKLYTACRDRVPIVPVVLTKSKPEHEALMYDFDTAKPMMEDLTSAHTWTPWWWPVRSRQPLGQPQMKSASRSACCCPTSSPGHSGSEWRRLSSTRRWPRSSARCAAAPIAAAPPAAAAAALVFYGSRTFHRDTGNTAKP